MLDSGAPALPEDVRNSFETLTIVRLAMFSQRSTMLGPAITEIVYFEGETDGRFTPEMESASICDRLANASRRRRDSSVAIVRLSKR
jgi:hypothetical protein